MKSVNSFYSLASRTCIDAVDLIVRKYLLLWCFFVYWKLHFTIQSNFKIKIRSNALKKLRSKNLWKL